MLCGKKVYPFNSNSTKNGWLKWRSEILVTHLQSIHHCVSPLISKSFLSFSTLYNSMKTEEIMKNTTISFGHSSKQQKLNSGERVSVSTSGSEISFLSNTPLICLSGLQSISKLDVTTVMRIISINMPLTTERNELYDYYWKDIIPSYLTIQRLSSLLYQNMLMPWCSYF